MISIVILAEPIPCPTCHTITARVFIQDQHTSCPSCRNEGQARAPNKPETAAWNMDSVNRPVLVL